jgi:hypothetical protein
MTMSSSKIELPPAVFKLTSPTSEARRFTTRANEERLLRVSQVGEQASLEYQLRKECLVVRLDIINISLPDFEGIGFQTWLVLDTL